MKVVVLLLAVFAFMAPADAGTDRKHGWKPPHGKVVKRPWPGRADCFRSDGRICCWRRNRIRCN